MNTDFRIVWGSARDIVARVACIVLRLNAIPYARLFYISPITSHLSLSVFIRGSLSI
jgi:hypothetical protein